LKLLVDENLAPELAEQLADLFLGSVHVTSVGLGSTCDTVRFSEFDSDSKRSLLVLK
jgi:predicted nuclease of predicted toxin-antitoxin system